MEKGIVELWKRWWSSLGNTNRSSQYNPAKGECLLPVPVAESLQVSSDDSTEDTVLYTPLLNGKIRGNLFMPSDVTISGAISNTKTLIVATGTIVKLIAIRNTGTGAAYFTFSNAAAASDATNTLMVTPSITNGLEMSLVQGLSAASQQLTDGYLIGPIYGQASAAENFRIVYATYGQVTMA